MAFDDLFTKAWFANFLLLIGSIDFSWRCHAAHVAWWRLCQDFDADIDCDFDCCCDCGNNFDPDYDRGCGYAYDSDYAYDYAGDE